MTKYNITLKSAEYFFELPKMDDKKEFVMYYDKRELEEAANWIYGTNPAIKDTMSPLFNATPLSLKRKMFEMALDLARKVKDDPEYGGSIETGGWKVEVVDVFENGVVIHFWVKPSFSDLSDNDEYSEVIV